MMTSYKGNDISANRRYRKYHTKEMILRVLWGLIWPFFRFSPRVLFSWRNFLLRTFGAKIGNHVHVYNSAQIYYPWHLRIGDWSAIGEGALVYNLGIVTIGNNVTISQRAHLCAGTHDYTDPEFPLIKPTITIGNDVWVCADAFVGPGVTMGDGSVAAARAVVTKDTDAWRVVAGNPAKEIKIRTIKSDG